VLLLDVRKSAAMRLVGRYNEAAAAQSSAVRGNHLFIADGGRGLLVVRSRPDGASAADRDPAVRPSGNIAP
jgi:hypothetical protein